MTKDKNKRTFYKIYKNKKKYKIYENKKNKM